MAEIFGVDENTWCRALTDALKKLEVRKKDRDKGGDARSMMSPPVKASIVGHTLDHLEVFAWLEGEPEERIHLKIGIR